MSIRKITDGEIEAASVSRLPDRPNESGGYGKPAMSASELRQAFDALGRLCAERYNELCSALVNGSAASDIQVGDKSLDELLATVNEKADTEAVADAFLEAERALQALTSESQALKRLTASHTEAILSKLDAAEYNEAPAIKGGESVPLTLLNVQGGSFPIKKIGEKFVIKSTASLSVGGTKAFSLATFSVKAGERYCVYTEEAYPARYYADKGDAMHTHIIDGLRLRVGVDTDKGSKLYKLTNAGCGYERLIHTSEPICFTAEGDGTASIALSIYNQRGQLAFPFADAEITLSLRVSHVAPKTPLALDEKMMPAYRAAEQKREGDRLLSVPVPDEDAFGTAHGLPVKASGSLATLRISEGYSVTAAYDGDGVTILCGSRQPVGTAYDLLIGEFNAVKGRTYRVFTRSIHSLGKNDGYYLTVSDGKRSYCNEGATNTRVGFVFTAKTSGRHKVYIHISCANDLVPEEYTEDLCISAIAEDVTESGSERLSGSAALSEGNNTFLTVTALPSGKALSELSEIGIKLLGCHAGESYRIEIEDGNGTLFSESRTVKGSGEVFVLETSLWTARATGTASSDTESLLSPFGRDSYLPTGIQRLKVIYTAASPFTLRYVFYAR